MVVGTAGYNGEPAGVSLCHFSLDLFRRHTAAVAGLGIGIAGFDAVQTGLDQTVNIGRTVHCAGRKTDRLIDQIGMCHDHDAAAAVHLADHLHGIRFFTQDLIGRCVLDHELGTAPVLLIALARDQLENHLLLHLLLSYRISSVLQDLFPCHMHAVCIQTADQFPVTPDLGFHHSPLEIIEKRILPVTAQTHQVAVLRRCLTGNLDPAQQTKTP